MLGFTCPLPEELAARVLAGRGEVLVFEEGDGDLGSSTREAFREVLAYPGLPLPVVRIRCDGGAMEGPSIRPA